MISKHPCTPDCPRRSATCHSTCKEYQEYEKAKKVEYQERARQQVIKDYYCEMSDRIKTKQFRKHKLKKWK